MTKKLYRHQLPHSYRLSKELNDHFYKKYIGNDIDIKFKKWQISMIERRIYENKRHSLDTNIFLSNLFNTTSTSLYKEIQEHKKCIEDCMFFRKHFLEYYQESTRQLNNHNIIEI